MQGGSIAVCLRINSREGKGIKRAAGNDAKLATEPKKESRKVGSSGFYVGKLNGYSGRMTKGVGVFYALP